MRPLFKTEPRCYVPRGKNFLKFFLVFLSLLTWSSPAEAYLDPNVGGQLFQLIAAGILGGLFALKMYFQKAKRFFKNLFSGKVRKDDEENT